MKKYDSFKKTTLKGLPTIPAHWNLCKVKDIALIKGRIGFRGYTKGDFVEKNQGGLVIGATEMTDKGNIVINNPQFLSWEKYYESPEIILKLNDILIVQRGSTVGKVAMIGIESENATINPSLVILKKVKCNNKYLLYFFMSPYIQGFISTQVATTAIPMISQEQIGNYEVVLPSLPEQTAIATYLDHKTQATDKKVALLTQKAAYYKELRKALINRAVTEGIAENVKMKESGVHYMPKIKEHWQVLRVKDIFNIGRGRVIGQDLLSENGKYPVYSSQTENNGCLGYIDTYDFNTDLLTWTTDGVNAGTVFKRMGKFNCTNVCGTLTPIRKNLDLNYMTYALQESTKHNKRIDTNGAKIMNNEMAVIQIPFPPLSEQITIATYLDQKTSLIDAIVTNIEKQVVTLKELRKTLINEVVTGKVKIN